MIDYFIYSSHPLAEERVRERLWGETGLAATLRRSLAGTRYGAELIHVMVGLYIEGDIPLDAPTKTLAPGSVRVRRWNSKEKSIRVEVALNAAEISTASDVEVRQCLSRATLQALEGLAKKKLPDFNLSGLKAEVSEVTDRYCETGG